MFHIAVDFIFTIHFFTRAPHKVFGKGWSRKNRRRLVELSRSRPANQISSLSLHQVATSGCGVVWRLTRAGHRLVFHPTTGRLEQRKSSLLLMTSTQKILISPICSTPTFGWKPRNALSYFPLLTREVTVCFHFFLFSLSLSVI